jgi:16S rRNA (cytosine967-C5)-methyltransferase
VPHPAAIDESVRLASRLTNPGAAGYINATLRRLSGKSFDLPAGQAVFYSLTPEIFGYLRKWYGSAEAALLAESFLSEDGGVTARVNCLKVSPEQLTADLAAAGVTAVSGRYCPEALGIDLCGQPIRGLQAWQRGDFSIQDEAAMLVGHAADPAAGQIIIDLCAAPGGKTCHLAELTGDSARILAFDSHPERLKLVSENAARLGLGSIECHQGDATGAGMDPDLVGSADLVLADVPCSGLGLLARKPEIRLTMNHERITGLYPLQSAILDYATTLVRPGGILIYSTCTINPLENIERVRSFLADNAGRFTVDNLTPHLPQRLLIHPELAESAAAGWLQLLPHRHGLDGFFIARLRRI